MSSIPHYIRAKFFHSSETAPLSKSAIKKAKAQARIEKRQQEKAARAAARLQAKVNGDLATSIDSPASSVTPVDSPVISSKPLEEEPVNEEPPALVEPVINGDAHGEASEVPTPEPAPLPQVINPGPPPIIKPLNPPLSRKEDVPPVPALPVEKPKPVINGAAVEPAKIEEANPRDAEKAKKRQNALTRTLWTFIMIGGFLGES